MIISYKYLYCTVLSLVCSSVREFARGAQLTYLCIRGVIGAISTALTSVVGYADPSGDGPPHRRNTSMTLPIGPTP